MSVIELHVFVICVMQDVMFTFVCLVLYAKNFDFSFLAWRFEKED